MELLGVSDDYRCRFFPTTLLDTAQEWYWKFKLNSISSWETFKKEFCRQFSDARTPPVYANHLADIKQGKWYEPHQHCDETRHQIWHNHQEHTNWEWRTATQCLAKHEPWYEEDATNGDGNPFDKSGWTPQGTPW